MLANAIDQEALVESVQNDPSLLSDLIDLFADYYPRRLQLLRKSIVDEDTEQLRELAHQLKGAVSNFHAISAKNTAYTLEVKSRNGDLRDIENLANRLENDLRELMVLLQQVLAQLRQVST